MAAGKRELNTQEAEMLQMLIMREDLRLLGGAESERQASRLDRLIHIAKKNFDAGQPFYGSYSQMLVAYASQSQSWRDSEEAADRVARLGKQIWEMEEAELSNSGFSATILQPNASPTKDSDDGYIERLFEALAGNKSFLEFSKFMHSGEPAEAVVVLTAAEVAEQPPFAVEAEPSPVKPPSSSFRGHLASVVAGVAVGLGLYYGLHASKAAESALGSGGISMAAVMMAITAFMVVELLTYRFPPEQKKDESSVADYYFRPPGV